MGVVVDHLAPARSKGTDYVITFVLHDLSWEEGEGLKIRYFHKEEDKLPAVKVNGDVVLLRNVKIKDMFNQPMGISNSATSWVVLPAENIPKTMDNSCRQNVDVRKLNKTAFLNILETQYAISLYNAADRTNLTRLPPPTSLQLNGVLQPTASAPSRKGEKFSLIRNLDLSSNPKGYLFVDLVGEVRRLYSNDFRIDLDITDYTEHKLLYDHVYEEQDETGIKQEPWPGPWGQMTLTVTMWDEHAGFARKNVKVGNFVMLSNVNVIMGRDGMKLEGKLRGDPKFPDKKRVSLLGPQDAQVNGHMKELLRRKREYEVKAKAQNRIFIRNASEMRSKRQGPDLEDSELPTNKKRNKRRNKNGGKASKTVDHDTTSTTEIKSLESNTHVSCTNVDVSIKPIDEIMDPQILLRSSAKGNAYHLPFQNCCYHSKVRVIDYFPDNIADFAAPRRPLEYESISDQEDTEESDIEMYQDGGRKWEWRFFLLVEDAGPPLPGGKQKAQMPLLVAADDGEYLMKMDACDLKSDPQSLAKVREKLFVLWGDLQERKEATAAQVPAGGGVDQRVTQIKPLAKPFKCLIKEYGVAARDETGRVKGGLEFERMFRIWGTTIH